MLDGTSGIIKKTMLMMRLALDTGTGLNIIRREALPPGCKNEVETDAACPRLSDENGNPFALG